MSAAFCKWPVYAVVLWVALLTLVLAACAPTPTLPPQLAEPPQQSPTLLSNPASAPPQASAAVVLRADHPRTYTVVPGDTLWDIAGRFLEDPWLWPRIWRQNPAIRNPHLIYPGDIIELYYEAGQPWLRLASGRSTIRLSPTIRYETLNQPIATLPREHIEPFLQHSLVLQQTDWSQAPYIIGADDQRLAFAARDRIYARGTQFDQRHYRVFRRGKEYRDPRSGHSLGFDAIYIGTAALLQAGDPATLMLTASTRETLVDDRLFPVDDEIEVYHFMPHPPPPDTRGQIIAVMDGVSLIGQYQTVVLNLGDRDGMKPGQVLGVFQVGREVADSVLQNKVHLPAVRAGLLMVYKVFDQTSYGLVTEATRTIRVFDRIGEP